MAVKNVVKTVVKKVEKKVAPKVIDKTDELNELVVDSPNAAEVLAFELAKYVGNYVMKTEVYGILSCVGEYSTEKLNAHLDRIDGARVSKQELMAIGASLFRK